METPLKEQVKQFRKQVKELQEQFNPIYHALLAQISSDDEMKITSDLGKLQFYLVDEVTSGFSQVTTGLHRIWETFPELVKDNPEMIKTMKKSYKLVWSPEGRTIATVKANNIKEAKKKTPKPYKQYMGEVYAEEIK